VTMIENGEGKHGYRIYDDKKKRLTFLSLFFSSEDLKFTLIAKYWWGGGERAWVYDLLSYCV